jgi:formylglycine-generating enzyme required for sulfatase activity
MLAKDYEQRLWNGAKAAGAIQEQIEKLSDNARAREEAWRKPASELKAEEAAQKPAAELKADEAAWKERETQAEDQARREKDTQREAKVRRRIQAELDLAARNATAAEKGTSSASRVQPGPPIGEPPGNPARSQTSSPTGTHERSGREKWIWPAAAGVLIVILLLILISYQIGGKPGPTAAWLTLQGSSSTETQPIAAPPASVETEVRSADGMTLADRPTATADASATAPASSVPTQTKAVPRTVLPYVLTLTSIPSKDPVEMIYNETGNFWIDSRQASNAQVERFLNESGYTTDADRDGGGWFCKPIEAPATQFPGQTYSTGKCEMLFISLANWQNVFGRGIKGYWGAKGEENGQLSWNDANTYCQWVGKRLPTSSEMATLNNARGWVSEQEKIWYPASETVNWPLKGPSFRASWTAIRCAYSEQ